MPRATCVVVVVVVVVETVNVTTGHGHAYPLGDAGVFLCRRSVTPLCKECKAGTDTVTTPSVVPHWWIHCR